MDEKDFIRYGEKAIECLHMGDEQGFFEVLGVIKHVGNKDYANMLTSLYFYKKKQFRKCMGCLEKIAECKNDNLKEMLTVWYWDFKICCLAEQKKFSEISSIFFEDKGLFSEDDDIKMQYSSYVYARYLAIKSGFQKDKNTVYYPGILGKNVIRTEDQFMSVIYRELGRDLLDIHLNYHALLQLKKANVEKNIRRGMKEKLLVKVQYICDLGDQKYYALTPQVLKYMEYLTNIITNEKNLNEDKLNDLIISLFSDEILIQDIDNWLFMVDLFSVTADNEKFINFFRCYDQFILKCLSRDNEIVAKKLIWMCNDERFSSLKYEHTTFKDYWEHKIEQYMPGFIKDSRVYSCDKYILDNLSEKSKWAYEAAIWQYENVMEYGSEYMDTGLLSLAFMRVLETELNARVIAPLSKAISEDTKGKTLLDKLLVGANSYHYKFLKKTNKGATLGQIGHFLEEIREKSIAEYSCFYNILCNSVLSVSGKEAIAAGLFEEMTSQKIIDKYRNPPAHSKYLQKSEAVKGKLFVEDSLRKLFTYITR